MSPKTRQRLIILVVPLLGFLALVAVVVGVVFDGSYFVPSEAMASTLKPGDHVLVRHVGGASPRRGDIVVFTAPEKPLSAGLTELVRTLPKELRPSPESKRIMRVVAVAGDRLEARNERLFINGKPAYEPYLARNLPTRWLEPMVVPPATVFVMGDNRTDSADSRAYGPVPTENIQARVELRYWPLGRFGRP